MAKWNFVISDILVYIYIILHLEVETCHKSQNTVEHLRILHTFDICPFGCPSSYTNKHISDWCAFFPVLLGCGLKNVFLSN